MKKLYFSFLLVLISAKLFAGHVEYSYQFSGPSVRSVGEFHVIAFDNTYLTGKTGEPALPYMGVNLLLPPGEEAISVEYVFDNEIVLDGIFSIYPQQPSRPLSQGSDDVFYQDPEVYQSVTAYPATKWGEYSTQFMNGHSILLASFTPVKYIPSTGQISYYQNVTVTIQTRTTERSTRALENLNTCAQTNSRISAMAQNSGMLASYPAQQTRDDGYQVLIITPQAFAATFQQLESLYLVRGLKTQIVTTETINSTGTGMDLQEKMRNYIIQEYQQNGISYVVLGGDNEYLPHRGFYCYVISGSGYEDSDIPADLYYSALDGSWNNDGDGYWGEIGEDDLLPDVAVGRYPVSTVAQLEKMIHKTTFYQDQPVTGELEKPLMAGENLWSDPLTYGEDYLELLIGDRSDNGYTTHGMPETYNYQKLYESQAYWDGNQLMQQINQGTSFLHHSGHANQTYVMKLDISQINNANFSGANGTDHNYTIVYTHGCLCGAFDENDCIGEAMVCIDNFAVAVVMNSRYGWFNEGQTEGPSAHLQREFVDALYHNQENHIGMAHMISKVSTSTWVNAPGQWEEGALRWCFYCCNVLGDPVLGLWTAEPITIQTEYTEEIMAGTTSIPVTVTSGGQPLAGANCVVMGDGSMLGCAVTDASGHAVVSIPQGFEGITSAELVVSGYNCLPHHYPLSIEVGTGEMPSRPVTLQIMPNPFTSETTLMIGLNEPKEILINYYITSGQCIGSQRIAGNAGMNIVRPDVSGWPVGMIVSEVITGDQVMHHRMIHMKK
jgi:hypothetical protein